MMTQRPLDRVFQLVERSPRFLGDHVWNKPRSLFSLELMSMMETFMSNVMHELGPHRNREYSSLGLPKDAFEVGEDGKLHFKVCFNAKDYKPEDITIQTGRNKLTMKAKKSVKKGGTRVEEFAGRSLHRPSSVDSEKLKATLTKDDVLVVEGPVNAPKYKSLEVEPKEVDKASIQPIQVEERQLARLSLDEEVVKIVTSEDGSKKMHMDLVVDEHFSPDDLKVWTKDGQMFVSGAVTKEEKNGNSMRSERFEFRRSFPIPEIIDVEKLKVEMTDRHLLLEAPINP